MNSNIVIIALLLFIIFYMLFHASYLNKQDKVLYVQPPLYNTRYINQGPFWWRPRRMFRLLRSMFGSRKDVKREIVYTSDF